MILIKIPPTRPWRPGHSRFYGPSLNIRRGTGKRNNREPRFIIRIYVRANFKQDQRSPWPSGTLQFRRIVSGGIL